MAAGLKGAAAVIRDNRMCWSGRMGVPRDIHTGWGLCEAKRALLGVCDLYRRWLRSRLAVECAQQDWGRESAESRFQCSVWQMRVL